MLLELRVATKDQCVSQESILPNSYLTHSFSLVTSVLRHFLRHALDIPAGHPFVDKLLMSLIFHSKGDTDQSRAIKDIADGLDGASSGPSVRGLDANC